MTLTSDPIEGERETNRVCQFKMLKEGTFLLRGLVSQLHLMRSGGILATLDFAASKQLVELGPSKLK